MSIVLSLNDPAFDLLMTANMANFMIWVLDHRPLRKGAMRHHDYSRVGSRSFYRLRESMSPPGRRKGHPRSKGVLKIY